MSDIRLGRQTPTKSVVLPYTESRGGDATDIYNRSGLTAQDWQALMLEDIMAVNPDGLWTHMMYGWSIPRRNGKSELLIMRSMYAVTHGELVLYTAHRTTTSHNAWEKIVKRLAKAGFEEDKDFKTTKKYGLETIEWLDGSGGIISFRTRTSKGGLGEGYDLLIIDEAQEYTGDQETALKYVVTDSKNPQTLMCGTPPTAVSSGTVFVKYRQNVLTGNKEDSGWAEWSVPRLMDAHDPELWYETNPSLGTILTERNIRSELGDDQVDDNIQRLGLWIQYNQKSAISKDEWMQCAVTEPPALQENPRVFYAVKYTKNTEHTVLCAAVKCADGRIFIEGIDCRPTRDGNGWLLGFLRGKNVGGIVIDGASGQAILADDLKQAGIKKRPILPKVAEVISANSLFEQKLFDGQIVHSGQPAMVQAVTNSEHRAIGSGGGFGYASLMEGAEAALAECAALAHWACANAKERKRQRITY